MQQQRNQSPKSWGMSCWLHGGFIAFCSRNGVAEETPRKIRDSLIKGTSENYQWMFKCWNSFHYQRGLSTLGICVSDLMECLDFLKVNHNCSCKILSMHASSIYSILQCIQSRQGLQHNPLPETSSKGYSGRIHLLGYGLRPGMSRT